MRILFLPISLVCLFFLTTACAPVKERFFWPLPPDEPKLEFIGVYGKAEDMLTGSFDVIAHSLTGTTVQPLRQPTAVAADSRGIVYVSDSIRHRVLIFDFARKTIEDLSSDLKLPFGLDVDSKDNLYVVQREGRQVSVFDSEHTLLFHFGKGELGEPIRIAVDDERGRIYVSDRQDQQIKVFSLEGKLIQTIGGAKGVRSEFDGEFNWPNDLEIDRAGNLYVCDQLNARIQVFDHSGAFVKKFGTRGDKNYNFEGPMGIGIDTSDNLWIADIRKAALLTHTAQPQFLMATYGPAASGGNYSFISPMDIFVDKKNRIYVADSLARRISILQFLDEAYLAQHPVPANWQQRTDALEIWYRDSGVVPPAKQKPAAPEKP